MRYFLDYNEKKEVIGWLAKNTPPIVKKQLTEVEPYVFKNELSRLGTVYELPEEKTERLEEENLIKTEEITDLDYRLANIELGLQEVLYDL